MLGVDYELAFARLRDHVLTKRSHGMNELLVAMARFESECRREPGDLEKFLRQFEQELDTAFFNATQQPLPEEPATGRSTVMPATSQLPTTHGVTDDRSEQRQHPRAA